MNKHEAAVFLYAIGCGGDVDEIIDNSALPNDEKELLHILTEDDNIDLGRRLAEAALETPMTCIYHDVDQIAVIHAMTAEEAIGMLIEEGKFGDGVVEEYEPTKLGILAYTDGNSNDLELR